MPTTTVFIYYRGSKALAFHSTERARVYMEAFVYRDLDALGLPRPARDDFAYARTAGVVKCWFDERDSVRLDLDGLMWGGAGRGLMSL